MRIRFFLLLILYLTIWCGCNISKKNDNSKSKVAEPVTEIDKKNLRDYIGVDIYCFCFRNSPAKINEKGENIQTLNDCSTPYRIKPFDLVEPEHLYLQISDEKRIGEIQNIVFENIDIVKGNLEIDSRFLMVFKKSATPPDTLVYINSKEFYFNNGHRIRYAFDVMDSLRQIIKIENIQCK